MGLHDITLDDKYTCDEGPIFLSAAQALVRIPLAQKRADRYAGLNTAGFISGYRGSPLGTYDLNLMRAKRHLQSHDVRFQPGVNEELAATAVYGSQQFDWFGEARHDGVFAIWYGKGPGVDRAGDALKHGNLAGAHGKGGVLVLAGDDHVGKSSTTAHQSEQALIAAMIPVLYPANVQEYLDYGAFGIALSRYAGLWAGFKCVNDSADATGTAHARTRHLWRVPGDVAMPPGGLNIRKGLHPLQQEDLAVNHRLPAAQAFVRANGLDRILFKDRRRELGIVAAGKVYLDVVEALDALGLDATRLAALGVGLYKPAMTWPLEPEGARAFAEGYRQLLVVEEKRGLIEPQIKDLLFNLSADRRPAVIGKTELSGRPLFSQAGELTAEICATGILRVLQDLGLEDEALRSRVAQRASRIDPAPKAALTDVVRPAFFCSGCPHNTSTRVPEGSEALAGIGCHVMAINMADRPHTWPVQMGGEGANWIGIAPFTNTPHIFQNLGDGTYYHSGFLAVRAAVAAQLTITYKILVNDAVAMTGGQPLEGQLSVAQMATELLQEGVTEVVVVSDEPDRYGPADLPQGVALHHRSGLDAVQRRLRETKGVTVILYEQMCAAEKRRRRKTGALPEPEARVFINDLVCEGCGDCSRESNCVSVVPLETEFGRKREIDQSNCNKDFSCVRGFCPSFVTVTGAGLKGRSAAAAEAAAPPPLPAPVPAALEDVCQVLITGIGGTGVVTVGAILGMAAHLEGKASSIMDMIGMSQKNGAVLSHLKIAGSPDHLKTARLSPETADLLLACDLIVAGGSAAVTTLRPGDTVAIVNDHEVATAAFQLNPHMDFQGRQTRRRLEALAEPQRSLFVNVTDIAVRMLGDSIATNMMMVGVALQKGLLPLSLESVERAIELNGVQVAFNKRALAIGRWIAVAPDEVRRAADPASAGGRDPAAPLGSRDLSEDLETAVSRRAEFLTGYQNRAWAERYLSLVRRVETAEAAAGGKDRLLTWAVARSLFKLMAYKDEYEVARLHTGAEFRTRLHDTFEDGFKLRYHLAPPLLARRNPSTGKPEKIAFGSWLTPILRVLAQGRRLRGTPFDPLGYTAERRHERQAIADYEGVIARLIRDLTPARLTAAARVAAYPQGMRGYGHVKAAATAAALAERDEALAEFEAAGSPPRPARRVTAMA